MSDDDVDLYDIDDGTRAANNVANGALSSSSSKRCDAFGNFFAIRARLGELRAVTHTADDDDVRGRTTTTKEAYSSSFSIASVFAAYGAPQDGSKRPTVTPPTPTHKTGALEFIAVSMVSSFRGTHADGSGETIFALACSASGSSNTPAITSADGNANETGTQPSTRAPTENELVFMDGRLKTKTATKKAPWYEGSRARIIAMAHSRDGNSLLCATSAGGVYVVPIWDIARNDAASPAIRVLASRGPAKPVSALWWYRKLERDTRADPVVGLCVSADGEVRAWDASKGSPLGACVVGGKCASAELARGKACQFLLISGQDGEVWTMMLEREVRVMHTSASDRSRVEARIKVESLPDAAGSYEFGAHALTDEYGVREGRRVVVSVQDVAHEGDQCDENQNTDVGGVTADDDSCSIIATIVDRNILELYDVDAPREPMSTHALPNHTVAVHVTDDLIFALVREPVLGDFEDINDVYSFTASVHVLARRFNGKERCLTLQTFHVPRRAGVPKKFIPGPPQALHNTEDDGAHENEDVSSSRRKRWLRGCMLWTSYGVFEIASMSDVSSALRAYLSTSNRRQAPIADDPSSERWYPVERDDGTQSNNAVAHHVPRPEEALKMVSRALREDAMHVFVDAASQELKRQNYARARELFEYTGKPLRDFVSLSLEVWEASQVLSKFSSASVEAYGGHVNMSWLKTAAAAHAHLHAWCEASAVVARDAADEAGAESTLAVQLDTYLNVHDDRSPDRAVEAVLKVVEESMRATNDAQVRRETTVAARAACVALEAAKAVTASVTAACTAETCSHRVRSLFTLLLSSTSAVESLHMLGGITANARRQLDSSCAETTTGGTVRAWEPQPLVFWDPNVTFYVTATQPLETMYDITTLLGLDSDTTEAFKATPLEIIYETLDENELWQLAMMAVAAKTKGVPGAAQIEVSVLLRLNDDRSLDDTIRMLLKEDATLYGWVLAKCLAYRKFTVAAATATKMEDFATASMCHNAYLDWLAAEGQTSESTIQAELELGIELYVARVQSVRAQAQSIEDVIRCWRRRSLDTDELERALLEMLVLQGHADAVQMILDRKFDFSFSGHFILTVAFNRMEQDETHLSSKYGATIDTLWTRIKENLVADTDAPTYVRTKAFTLAESSALSEKPNAVNTDISIQECWVFSCGHRLVTDDLRRAVKDSKQRLSILDASVSALLLESDYALDKCAAACPECTTSAIEARIDARRQGNSELVN